MISHWFENLGTFSGTNEDEQLPAQFKLLNLLKFGSWWTTIFRSDQISRSVVSDSLRPHESQHTRPGTLKFPFLLASGCSSRIKYTHEWKTALQRRQHKVRGKDELKPKDETKLPEDKRMSNLSLLPTAWHTQGSWIWKPLWAFIKKKRKKKKLFPVLVVQRVKRLPAMRETWVQSLGREDPLEKEMATHSSTLAWRIQWTEEPGGLQSMES